MLKRGQGACLSYRAGSPLRQAGGRFWWRQAASRQQQRCVLCVDVVLLVLTAPSSSGCQPLPPACFGWRRDCIPTCSPPRPTPASRKPLPSACVFVCLRAPAAVVGVPTNQPTRVALSRSWQGCGCCVPPLPGRLPPCAWCALPRLLSATMRSQGWWNRLGGVGSSRRM